MSELDLYRIADTNIPEILYEGSEGEGLHDMCSLFFREHTRLFRIMPQTSSTIGDIIQRQEAVKDILFRGGDSIFGFKVRFGTLLERLKHRDVVKIWKNTKQPSGYVTKEPLIYEHKKLLECVELFRTLCRDILESLSKTTSQPFGDIKGLLRKYVDDNSEVVQGWGRDKEILRESERPFLSLITQDPCSHKIEEFLPIGTLDESDIDRLKHTIKKALKNGVKKVTFTIGGESFDFHFLDMTCHDVMPKPAREPKAGRYVDFNLFTDIWGHVREACSILDDLSFYKSSADLHGYLKENKLPVCFPKIVEGNILKANDFYPLHLGLNPSLYVKNSIGLTQRNPFAIITGLNNGGKSTLLEMLECLSALPKTGSPIPASAATIGNFDSIIHTRTPGEERETGRGALLNQSVIAERDLGDLYDAKTGIGFFDESVSGTDAKSNDQGIENILQILMQEIHKPTVIVTHCTSVARRVLRSPKKYPGVQLFYFKRGTGGFPDRKMHPGVGESDGADIFHQSGLTLEQFRKAHKKGA